MGPRRFTLVLASLLLTACTTLRPSDPLAGVEWVPVPDDRERIESYLEAVRAGSNERFALRVVGKLSLETRDGSGSTRELIAVERPSRLRFESLDFLGQTRALLVADGERFGFYDGRSIETGRVSAETLRDLIGLDLDPDEAVRVLLGSPALAPGPALRVLARGDERAADLDSQRVRFTATGDLLGVEALAADGRRRWSVEYRDWQPADGGRYPARVSMSFPLVELYARLDVREAELNPELDRALFRIPGTREP